MVTQPMWNLSFDECSQTLLDDVRPAHVSCWVLACVASVQQLDQNHLWHRSASGHEWCSTSQQIEHSLAHCHSASDQWGWIVPRSQHANSAERQRQLQHFPDQPSKLCMAPQNNTAPVESLALSGLKETPHATNYFREMMTIFLIAEHCGTLLCGASAVEDPA